MSPSIAILGSTGSIGSRALEVLQDPNNHQRFKVRTLAAASQLKKLAQQCQQWQPRRVVVEDNKAVQELKRLLGRQAPPQLLCGEAGLNEAAAAEDTNWVLNALSGGSGLRPSLAALQHGKRLLLANKESLVSAGEILMQCARQNDGQIIPLDSEHNAILHCLPSNYAIGEDARQTCGLANIILTASGGPFLSYSEQELAQVTPEQAIAHPVWPMGAKISVDSASMMNKGLEIIEACILFSAPEQAIRVLIHPQSIIHCLAQFVDGSCIAQLSLPDMKLVIHQALCHPQYRPLAGPQFTPDDLGQLTFLPADEERFPCLRLARQAARHKKALPAAMSGSDEAAVTAFLARKIAFNRIAAIVEQVMQKFDAEPQPNSIAEVLEVDARSRSYVAELI